MNYGVFVNTVIDVVIVAFAIFLVVRYVQRFWVKPPAPVEPTTRECPYCRLDVPLKATRCGHCTSNLEI